MPPRDDRLTNYAKLLRKKHQYPLKRGVPWAKRKADREHPVATPFLVAPVWSGDQGLRPIDPSIAKHSAAIEIVDSVTHVSTAVPVARHSYHIRCRVLNLGAVGCYSGISEFYIASPAVLDALASGSGPRPAPLGYGPVLAPTNGDICATCQKAWIPSDPSSSILVRVYDPLMDMPQQPYDSIADRHVARRDSVPDFTGTYQGVEINVAHGSRTQIKIVIQQNYTAAAVSTYLQVGGPGILPAVPQQSGSASVLGTSFPFNFTEQLGGNLFTRNQWIFNLTGPNTLHFTHHRHFLMPGDGRPDMDFVGDLPRA